jgi:hypothetical protein
MASRPKLKLGGIVKQASETNIAEYGTGDQTGDLTSLIAIERKEKPVAAKVPAQGPDPKLKAAPAPKVPSVAKVPSAPSVAKVPSAPSAPSTLEVDLTKYDEPLSSYAIDILSEEVENPYKDKTEAPVFPIQSRLGFQKQIFRVFSSFNKIPEFGKAPDFDA